MRPPVILDALVRAATQNAVLLTEGPQAGTWAIAKPLGKKSLPTRVYHAWLVLRGRATAFQYAEDRINRGS